MNLRVRKVTGFSLSAIFAGFGLLSVGCWTCSGGGLRLTGGGCRRLGARSPENVVDLVGVQNIRLFSARR